MRFVKLFKCLWVSVIMVVFLSSCSYGNEKISYYSSEENYVATTGTVSYISYNDDRSILYLGFSNLTPSFDDVCFKIVGMNTTIVQANGIDTSLKIGDKASFISAPKYFGDGYVFPLVALSVDGKVLLEFEEGLPNLLEWLKG